MAVEVVALSNLLVSSRFFPMSRTSFCCPDSPPAVCESCHVSCLSVLVPSDGGDDVFSIGMLAYPGVALLVS